MGFKTRKSVGMTLLFSETKETRDLGVLKSYVRLCGSAEQASEIADSLGETEEESSQDTGLTYLGLSDVFDVGGPAELGTILGRTTREDWTSLADIERESKDLRSFSAECSNYRGDKFCVQLGFMSPNSVLGYCGVSVLTFLTGSSLAEVLAEAGCIGRSADFRRQVAISASPPEDAETLQFVAVIDIAGLHENPFQGGAFEVLERPIDDEWSPEEELLHPDDLLSYFSC